MRAVIFLGPSLPHEQARGILDAIYLPPARQSDILSAIGIHRPDVIGLVDGEFRQSLSVWHKEILYALDQGIPVFGASSMGALRAAELDRFGMVGVGTVYRQYADGLIEDDDEVALAHGLDGDRYRALSEPMVNIRATLEAGVEAGCIPTTVADQLAAIAKELFYPDRSFARIFRIIATRGLTKETLTEAQRFVAEHYVDLKRDDAIRLLETIRDLPNPVPRPRPVGLERTAVFETLLQRDRRVRHEGTEVSLATIANYAALHEPGFNDTNAHALNRALVGVLADFLEVDVDDEQIDTESRRFRIERRLPTDVALEEWCRRHDLSSTEYRSFIRDRARCRQLHRWLVAQQPILLTTKIVLDELRHRGSYPRVAAAAAAQVRILGDALPFFVTSDHTDLPTDQLMIEHMRATPCRLGTSYRTWAEESGFPDEGILRMELLRSRAARRHVAEVAQQAASALAEAAAG